MMSLIDVVTGIQCVETTEGYTLYVPRENGQVTLTYAECDEAAHRLIKHLKQWGMKEVEAHGKHPAS